MPTRGTYNFETDNNGMLVDNPANMEKVRALFRDAGIIDGGWGPGNYGDFDNGSWHILCHLAGGSGVLNTRSGRAWCGITHVPANDTYAATITFNDNGAAVDGTVGQQRGRGAREWRGSASASSKGHRSATSRRAA